MTLTQWGAFLGQSARSARGVLVAAGGRRRWTHNHCQLWEARPAAVRSAARAMARREREARQAKRQEVNARERQSCRAEVAARRAARRAATAARAAARAAAVAAWGRFCVVCGEDTTDVLDAHHVYPRRKARGVVQSALASERGFRELLECCVPLCANCHRRVHAAFRRDGHHYLMRWPIVTPLSPT